MATRVKDNAIKATFKVILTAFNTTGDWGACDAASILPGLLSADLKGGANGDDVAMQIETIVLRPTYEDIAVKVAEVHADQTWDCLIHVAPANGSSDEMQFAKGAELMGYNQVDAVGDFAPMVNPLRGTRGVQGKGRKCHTTVDVDELVRCLRKDGSLQGALGACDNPGLGAAGFLYASSLKAAGQKADNVRPVLCFLTTGTYEIGSAASASRAKQTLVKTCQWLAKTAKPDGK